MESPRLTSRFAAPSALAEVSALQPGCRLLRGRAAPALFNREFLGDHHVRHYLLFCERLPDGRFQLLADENWRLKTRKQIFLDGPFIEVWDQLLALGGLSRQSQRAVLPPSGKGVPHPV